MLNADMTVRSAGTSYAWEHRYTGRLLDPGSGLQLNRNRYYHQQLGRWCSRDPIGYDDGQNLYSEVDPNYRTTGIAALNSAHEMHGGGFEL